MHARKLALVGILALLPLNLFGQGQIDIRNTLATAIYTNDCNGHTGLLRTDNSFRFMVYVGPVGSTRYLLTLVAVFTNPPAASPGLCMPPSPFVLAGNSGQPIAVQIRVQQVGVPFPLTGESEIGYVTPTAPPNPFPIPVVFGNDFPGQIGGFEVRACPPFADGPFVIAQLWPGISISWTNAWPLGPTNYRIRSTDSLTVPWADLGVVPGTNTYLTFALPPSASTNRFYMIEGTNALPAQPFGSWEYQALDKSGALIAGGILRFTSGAPLLGSYNITRLQNFLLHPAGSNTFTSAILINSNVVQVNLSPEFRVRGQMIGNNWSGDWEATEPVIGGGMRMHGARFIGYRRNQTIVLN